MDAFIQAGYPYELAGLLYYAFFVLMTRGRGAARFSQRSRILTLLAAMALIGSVPLRYAAQPLGVAAMLGLVAVAMASTWLDRGRAQPADAKTTPTKTAAANVSRASSRRAKARLAKAQRAKAQPKAQSSSSVSGSSSPPGR